MEGCYDDVWGTKASLWLQYRNVRPNAVFVSIFILLGNDDRIPYPSQDTFP